MKSHVVPSSTHLTYRTENALSRGAKISNAGAATKVHKQFLSQSRKQAAAQFESNHGCSVVPVEVRPLNVGPNPMNAFVNRSKQVKVQPRFAWHGTDVNNHPSIERHGLLVPGGDGVAKVSTGKPRIAVAHGKCATTESTE